MSDLTPRQTVVGKTTKGEYIIQEQSRLSKSWFDQFPLGDGTVGDQACTRLKQIREKFPEDTFRLIYRRTEVTDELEVGAHQEADA